MDAVLVDTTGSYSGWVFVGNADQLGITASDSWSVDLHTLTTAIRWDGRSPLNGAGAEVVLLAGHPARFSPGEDFGTTTITGGSDFAITVYDEEGAEIGEFGYHPSPPGVMSLPKANWVTFGEGGQSLLPALILGIQDTGNWSLSGVRLG